MWQENSACLRLAVALQINETQSEPSLSCDFAYAFS